MATDRAHRIMQYFGPWAMNLSHFDLAVSYARGLDLADHVKRCMAVETSVLDTERLEIQDDVAILHIVGMLTKYGSSLLDGPATVGLRLTLRGLRTNESVKAIVLRIDSPGGMLAGVNDLADDIWRVGQTKPVTAFLEDEAASGAYWLASQAGRIVASPGTMIGGIGVYSVVRDTSGQLAKEGIVTHVIRAGALKGAGTPGSPVTDEQLNAWQKEVNSQNELFLAAIARGRGMDPASVAAVAGGTMYVASQAVENGLIDEIGTLDSAIANAYRFPLKEKIGVSAMSNAQEPPSSPPVEPGAPGQSEPVVPAGEEIGACVLPDGTCQDGITRDGCTAAGGEWHEGTCAVVSDTQAISLRRLHAVFPDASSDFRERCALQGLTLNQAQKAWSEHLASRVHEQEKRVKDSEAEVARLRALSGAVPIGTSPASPPASGPERYKFDWESDPSVQAEFRGDFESYKAYRQAEIAGQARILKTV